MWARLFFLVVLLFPAYSAYSADTYWAYTLDGYTVRDSTPAATCARAAYAFWGYQQAVNSNSSGWCEVPTKASFFMNQGTCPSGTKLQSQTGSFPWYPTYPNYACLPFDQAAACQAKTGQGQDNILFPVIGGSASNSACLDGCSVSRNGSTVVVDGATQAPAAAKFTGAVCNTGAPVAQPTQNNQCAEVNGVSICVSNSNPDCGTLNGKNVCLQTPPKGSCTYLPGGSYVCDSVAPDDVTHKPIDANGNYIPPSASIVPGSGSTAGGGVDYWGSGAMGNASNGTAANGNGGKVGDCVGASCGSGDGEQEGASFGGGGQFQPGEGSGQFPNAEADAEITAKRQQLSDLVSSIRSEVSGMFNDMLSEGSGELPCTDQVEILGKTIDFCFTEFEGALSNVRLALLFIVLVVCLMLVLGTRG